MFGITILVALVVLAFFLYARPKKPRRSHYFQGPESKADRSKKKDPIILVFFLLLIAFVVFCLVSVFN